MIVVDASVFNKLFLNEPDTPEAVALFRHALETGRDIIAPTLLLFEALSVALHYGVSFEAVHDLLSAQRSAGMRLLEPDRATILNAHKIATDGSPKSGYPSLQDAIYHAMAIELDAVFVTADRRHVSKAGHFGHIALLADRLGWQG